MFLRKYCRQSLLGNVIDGRLTVPSRTLYRAPDGDVEIFTCGTGCKDEGFSQHQWIFRIGSDWFIRFVGGGQRGQARRTNTTWSTRVRPATEDEIGTFEEATIIDYRTGRC